MKSRLYWPRGGYSRGGVPGTAKRARPQGVVVPGAPGALQQSPPTPGPCRALRGPLRWDCLRFTRGWVYRYYPPLYPPQSHTHPVYPPWYPPALHVRHAGTDCSYTRFGMPVGEPRGSRTHPYIDLRAGYTHSEVNIQVYTAV